MELFDSLLSCLGIRSDHSSIRLDDTDVSDGYGEKVAGHPFKHYGGDEHQEEQKDIDRKATAFMAVLLDAQEETAQALKRRLEDTLTTTNWTEGLAAAILSKLVDLLTRGVELNDALQNAFDRAVSAAVDFAKEHPVYATLIAIGVLVLIAPWAVEALGFGELGPIEGSWAAAWQSRYAGYVPKGSLFSFLQRCGMVWKH